MTMPGRCPRPPGRADRLRAVRHAYEATRSLGARLRPHEATSDASRPAGSDGYDTASPRPAAPASPLPAVIDELWEPASRADPRRRRGRPRRSSAAVDMIDSGLARVAWVDRAGDIAVDERAKRAILLAFRLLPMVKSQVGDFRYHDRVPLTARLDGVRVVAGLDRPLGRLRGARRRADAVLRQHRRLRRLRHDGGHLGHRRVVRPDWQERAPGRRGRHRRRARAAERGARRDRGRRVHQLPLHGGGGGQGPDRRGARALARS